MTNLHIKLLFAIFIFTQFIACKKDKSIDNSGKYIYSDDNITVSEIIANFNTIVDGGNFNISAGGLTGGVNGENIAVNSKKTFVLISGRKFSASKHPVWLGGYYVPDYLTNTTQEINDIYKFFSDISLLPKSNFKLFDTTDTKLVEFNLHNPKSLSLSIDNQNYRDAPAGSRIIVHWNSDLQNELGIAIVLSGNNGIKYLHFDENGSADITDAALEVAGNDRISVTVSRGVILIGKGSDNRDYKINNRVESTEIVYL